MAQGTQVGYNIEEDKRKPQMKFYSKYGVRFVPPTHIKELVSVVKALSAVAAIVLGISVASEAYNNLSPQAKSSFAESTGTLVFFGGSVGALALIAKCNLDESDGPDYITGPRGGRYTVGKSYDGGEYKRYR